MSNKTFYDSTGNIKGEAVEYLKQNTSDEEETNSNRFSMKIMSRDSSEGVAINAASPSQIDLPGYGTMADGSHDADDDDQLTTWQRFKNFILRKRPHQARSIPVGYNYNSSAFYNASSSVSSSSLTTITSENDGGNTWKIDPNGNKEWSRSDDFAPNIICNQKYSFKTFFIVCFLLQFKSFINTFYLLISLTQFVPALKVGFLFTYVGPLLFVIGITMLKELYDDIKRYKRDKEVNGQQYKRLTENGFITVSASELKVGHIIQVNTNERLPADLLLLRTSEKTGASFVRTDQLDGETDWKLRLCVPSTQALGSDQELLALNGEAYVEKPNKEIYKFIGNYRWVDDNGNMQVESLNLENTMWANTVVASGNIVGLVIYSGSETRSAMNTTQPPNKKGTTDNEINFFAMFLGVIMVLLSFLMITGNLYHGNWLVDFIRYMILYTFIVPISMSVNLDMAKLVYVFFVMNDKKIRGTIVRNTGIPEELGRISYLMSDKTGTLTQNEMEFRKLNLGSISFTQETLEELAQYVAKPQSSGKETKKRKLKANVNKRVRDAVTAIALCHNVTPVVDWAAEPMLSNNINEKSEEDEFYEEKFKQDIKSIAYQASSPDEVALVEFTESVGLTLIDRDFNFITLRDADGNIERYQVLKDFPFTSAKKRMGIIVKNEATGRITFLMKGADVVMTKIVQYSDWLDEQCNDLAREGLRTLVFGSRDMTEEEYQDFARKLHDAKTSTIDREEKVLAVEISIEENLELIGLTGVEDKLQVNVRGSLETLRHAGVKIWMLTGDKIETATCIARSSKLVAKNHSIHSMAKVTDVETARRSLFELAAVQNNTVLVIDGTSLQLCLEQLKDEFFNSTKNSPSVVCCRCSPTQKAEVVSLIKTFTKKQTAAIGDGGNDVSMIQAADVGIGIEGLEGKQASMAADFSITQFQNVTRLLLWHGRNSYQRTCTLSQFLIHRGMIITFVQVIFSAIYYWSSITLFDGMLMLGYSTYYTSAPIFLLILDEDVTEQNAFLYPELYQHLQKGRAFSAKTFIIWTWQSIYQGVVIGILPIFLYEYKLTLIDFMAFSFTAITFVILINCVHEMQSWNLLDPSSYHPLVVASHLLTLGIYLISMVVLHATFNVYLVSTAGFWGKVAIVVLVATVPIYFAKIIRRRLNPPAWTKVK